MKTWLTTHGRALSIGIVLLLMLGLLAYVALRAGPLAPVAVRLATVEQRAISPSLFGIGTVQARFTHKIGPIAAGRVKQVTVQPGDFVKAGQLLGEMDPVDLNDRIGALDASRKRAEANLLLSAEQLLARLDDPQLTLLDARAPARFSGAQEPIDPRGGHIPGAQCAPFAENLQADGRFLPSEALRSRFAALLGTRPPAAAVAYCGSGITACHNLFALCLAGYPLLPLYAGSWSEWITDPQRPVATGA